MANYQTHVTYQVVSSSAAEEWLKAQKGEKHDCDCMLLISLCHGKQTVIKSERTTKMQSLSKTEQKSPDVRADEIMINDQERPKHLIRQDLGLTLLDKDWHNPLLCTVRIRALKNNRQRSEAAQANRRARYERYQQTGYSRGWQNQEEEWEEYDPVKWETARPRDSSVRLRSRSPTPRGSGATSSFYRPPQRKTWHQDHGREDSEDERRRRDPSVPRSLREENIRPDVRDERTPTLGRRTPTPPTP